MTAWRERPGAHPSGQIARRRARTRAAITEIVLVFFLCTPWPSAATPAAAETRWSWLGVRIRDLSEVEMDEITLRHGIREGYGVVIVAVLEDSPASRARIRSGDVVVGFADRPIVDSRTFQRVVGRAPVDRDLPLTVLRRGEGRRQVAVRLVPMPREIAGERVAAEFGFFVREVVAERAAGTSPGPMESVAVVADVLSGSPAERGGLLAGDVLHQINDEMLPSFRDASLALARVPLDAPLRLVVRRSGADDLPLVLPHPGAP